VKHIVIKSDSSLVVQSMVSHIHKWQRNGWLTAKAQLVKNQDLLRKLDCQVTEFEDDGVSVDFWLVRREQNADTDGLLQLNFEALSYRYLTRLVSRQIRGPPFIYLPPVSAAGQCLKSGVRSFGRNAEY
jgi:hypothetical protein